MHIAKGKREILPTGYRFIYAIAYTNLGNWEISRDLKLLQTLLLFWILYALKMRLFYINLYLQKTFRYLIQTTQ